jgi:hypothetical protein
MAKKKTLTVKSVHYVHTADIDPEATKAGGDAWEGFVNVCVKAAEEALETPPNNYSPYQRNSLTDIFTSMKATHRGIRVLVKLGDGKPESVDALVLARLQLEGLYTTCLLVEKPENVDRFTHEAWKRQYIRWLLGSGETQNLPRFQRGEDKEYQRLMFMMKIWNVSEDEKLTIDCQECETGFPPGFVPKYIDHFPTPGAVIGEMPAGTKRTMLERLYLEYQDLCAYAHGRPVAGFGKSIFDERSPLRTQFMQLWGEEKLHDEFRQRILGAAQIYSLLSVAQATAELTTLYATNVDLLAAATKAWNELHNSHLLVNAVWNIRTKRLLGVI